MEAQVLGSHEIRETLDAIRREMAAATRSKAEVWKGKVVEVGSGANTGRVRLARADEPTVAAELLRPFYPVVGDVPAVAAEVWALSWTGGGLVITGGSGGSGSGPFNSLEGVTNPGGNVDMVGTGGIAVTGDDAANTITIDGSGVSGGGGGPAATIEGVSNPGGNIDVTGSDGLVVAGDDTNNTIDVGIGTFLDLPSNAAAPAAPAADFLRLHAIELTGNFAVPEVRTEDGNRWRLHRDRWQNAYNNTGVEIPAGTIVATNGIGANGYEIEPARADAIGTMPAWGITLTSIAAAARGWVQMAGQTANLVDTSALTPGAPIYVSPSVAGGITTTRPSTVGHFIQCLGVVGTAANPGQLYLSGDMQLEEVQAAGAAGFNVAKMAADVTSSGTVGTFVDATGLSFAMTSGKTYVVRCTLIYTVAATTTAMELSWSGPAMTRKGSRFMISLTTTSQQVQYFENADAGVIGATSALSGTGINIGTLEGAFTPSANGTFQIRFASDVASGVVARLGSVLEWIET